MARSTKIDATAAVEEYINKEDWRINANANTSYSHASLINNLAGKTIANYWLDKVYSKEEGEAHRNGDYHIHDLDCLSAYCCGSDFQKLLDEGFNGVNGRVGSRPPKHFREALYQLANYFGIMQAEWAGAQAVSSFDTYLAPYVFFDMVYEGLSEDEVKKAIRNFVYNVNVPSRWGQSPFTNVTIDWTVPQMMKDLTPTRGGENLFISIRNEWVRNGKFSDNDKTSRWVYLYGLALDRVQEVDGDDAREAILDSIRNSLSQDSKDKLFSNYGGRDYEGCYRVFVDEGLDDTLWYQFTYKYFQKEMNIINRCFYEVLNEGDMLGVPFTFPIPTINITEDFDWEGENVELLFENTAKYGSSYFQNFIGSQYMKDENGNKVRNPNAYSPNDVRSMCPLTLDTVVPTNNGMKMMKDLNEQTDRVFYNDVWYAFKRIDNVPEQDVYEITLDGFTSDGKPMVIRAGAEHLQPIYNNQTGSYIKKQIKNVSSFDYLPVERIVDMRAGREIIPDFRSVIRGRDQLFYVAIKSIRKIERQPLMCIEVANHEHNFTLGSCIVTSNCRLQLDKKQLRKRGGGLFGSDAKTGSVGVVTINMARLGYLHKGNEKALFDALDGLMEMAKSTLEKKREVVVDFLERGLYPYTRRYIGSFDTFFSTIGVNGMNEMVRNFTNDEHDITTPFGQEFAKKILMHIRERLVIFQEETGNLYNLEATPAEGTMRRFAHLDKKKYPDILQAGDEETPFYTNSAQLPVDFTDDAFTALDLQDDLQCLWTAGTVFHIYMRERISSADACKRLVKAVLTNYRLPYISVTPTFSVCPKHGRLEGEQEYCPLCDQEIINRHAKEVDINL